VELNRRLAEVLGEFARTMLTDFPIQSILDLLVRRVVDVLPVEAAGATLISPGTRPQYVAASDDAAFRYEQLQSTLGEGPCVAAFESGGAVAVPDLRKDHRFPSFAQRALEDGLGGVFTFPLRHGNQQLGALDLYRRTPGPLTERVNAAAQLLADVAAAYLSNAHVRDELREGSERARQNALHDALTGLPNRILLIERLAHAILRCRRSKKMVGVLFVDLDRFDALNDREGRFAGDRLLIAIAGRIGGILRPGDTLARLTGDEFVVVCEELEDVAEATLVAARITKALTHPFAIEGVDLQIGASIGIAFANRADQIAEDVLRNADIAMYQAKRAGGGYRGVIDLRPHAVAIA
jgi:diguanylate cyclase (GGDEF)-like protein